MDRNHLEKLLEQYKKTRSDLLSSAKETLFSSSTIDDTFFPGDVFSFGEFMGIIVDDGKDCYWCCKVSEKTEFASPYDVIVNVKGKKFIVETSNVFLVSENVINKASKLGSVKSTDFEYVIKAYDGEEISPHKTGEEFTSKDDPRFEFLKEEQNIVKEFMKTAGRSVFLSVKESQKNLDKIENNCIVFSFIPEDVFELVAADTEKEIESTDNFALLKEEDNIVIIPANRLIGKKGVVSVFDEKRFYESLPEKIFLKSEDGKLLSVPLSALVEKIEVKRIDDEI